MNYSTPHDEASVTKTIAALKANNIGAFSYQNREEALKKIHELIPEGSEVMTMTSVTLDTLGLPKVFNESGKYNAVRTKLADKNISPNEKRKLGAAPDFALGSLHAVTEDGKIMVASNTGSQLPAYAYGAEKVVFVVGTQKIVVNAEEGHKRIYEYVLPLESDRAHKAYGVPGSFVSKILTINKEVAPDRITVIFINEALGF